MLDKYHVIQKATQEWNQVRKKILKFMKTIFILVAYVQQRFNTPFSFKF
ncbi:hypothetical protein E4J71_03950 [Peribacillus frigoritolerans]|nr:hypothetical protein E4J71_03950 [Peribacillus frigoritolerans]